jgi:hypothetical protein
LILIAVGAILVWAVTGDAEGVDIDAVGWILMIVGAVSALLSLIFWSSAWGPTRRTYVEGRPRRRRVVEEEDDLGPPVP